MSIYVITGGTTGIGAATREKLQEQGHEVFNIDYKGGDYTADLSTKEGRKGAIEAVYQRYPDGIDCFISNAGVGPTVPAATLFSLNYFAATELAEGLQPLLKKKRGNCVMTASNSITFPYVRQDWVDMLTNIHDEDSFTQIAQGIPPQAGPACYSTSKHALTRWMHHHSYDAKYDSGTKRSSSSDSHSHTIWQKRVLGCGRNRQWNYISIFPYGQRRKRNHFICGRRNRRTVAF